MSYSRTITDRQYIARFHERSVITPNRCFIWTGTESTKGYGMVSYRNKQWLIHRLSHVIHLGPIIPGKLVCHTCDNRRCWNPDHLWLGTNRENMVDCSRKGRAWKQQNTACKRGHPYTPETVRLLDMGMTNKRVCKLCARFNMRVRMGWPPELAATLGPVRKGFKRDGTACKKSH
jgi:hypothetical protein